MCVPVSPYPPVTVCAGPQAEALRDHVVDERSPVLPANALVGRQARGGRGQLVVTGLPHDEGTSGELPARYTHFISYSLCNKDLH